MSPDPWSNQAPDFLLSKTPGGQRLLTPFTAQAQWFLPSLDPDRLLPRLGPALCLHTYDASSMVQLLQGSGFTLRAWSPLLTSSTEHLTPYDLPPPAPPPVKTPPLSWPYDFRRMSERQLLVLRSLLDLPPGKTTHTIALN